MSTPNPRPAILIDVDGPLNPDKPGRGYREYRIIIDQYERYKVWLNAEHGPMLKELAGAFDAELMWCTFWNSSANRHIGPKIGLPQLPIVEIDEGFWDLGGDMSGREAEWKAACVASWCRRRPFVWFDDEELLPDLVRVHPSIGRHRIIEVNPRTGLTQDHVDEAAEWLKRWQDRAQSGVYD